MGAQVLRGHYLATPDIYTLMRHALQLLPLQVVDICARCLLVSGIYRNLYPRASVFLHELNRYYDQLSNLNNLFRIKGINAKNWKHIKAKTFRTIMPVKSHSYVSALVTILRSKAKQHKPGRILKMASSQFLQILVGLIYTVSLSP